MSRRFDPYIQMERQRAAAARRAVAEARAQDASRKRLDRMERMDHLARQLTEAEQETARIADQIKGITDLLGSALPMAWPLEFASLHRAPQFPVFDPQGQDRPLESPRLDSFLPRPLSFMAKLLPGARTRHATAVAQATADFEAKKASATTSRTNAGRGSPNFTPDTKPSAPDSGRRPIPLIPTPLHSSPPTLRANPRRSCITARSFWSAIFFPTGSPTRAASR